MARKKVGGRAMSREVLEKYRFRAVELRKKGWKVNDIAESFGIHRGSVSRWLTKQKREGMDSLRRRTASGASPKLEVREVRKILSLMKSSATDFGFTTPLWDCRRVQQLIKKECQTDMHISNVWRMLRSWNFTPKIPEKRALEQNEDEVAIWLDQEWPKIKAHCRRWKAILYFEDECGVSLIPTAGRTWSPRGDVPIVRLTGSKGGLCVSSAISPGGRMVFRIEKERVTGGVHVEFLEQMLKRHPRRKIIVIEDRAPAHRAKSVTDFIAQNKKRFARYFLPAYSPELNPDEDTWRYLKGKKMKSHMAQSKEELKKVVFSGMKSIQSRPAVISSFFYGTYVT